MVFLHTLYTCNPFLITYIAVLFLVSFGILYCVEKHMKMRLYVISLAFGATFCAFYIKITNKNTQYFACMKMDKGGYE